MSEYTTYRNDYLSEKEKKTGKRLKPIYKKIKKEKLYILVKDYIFSLKEDFVHAEDIAKAFQVKTHEIEEIFKKLNQEGILSQAINAPPHDCFRNMTWFGYGYDNSWIASIYYIRKKKDE